MSRIGKTPIKVPSEVTATFDAGVLKVQGPKGTLLRKVRDEIGVEIKDGEIIVTQKAKNRLAEKLWGTYASHASNMVEGVLSGFKKELKVEGVGYRAEVAGGNLVLRVGYSHPVEVKIPEGLSVEAKENLISITGFDKEKVGQFAAEVRAVRKPEPYKGKGIRYIDEVVRRKQGKKSA